MHSDVQLMILEARGCNHFLRLWARQFDHHRQLEVSDFRDHMAAHFNRALAWFRDHCTLPWLLLIQDDVVPLPETEALLTCDAALAVAQAWGRAGTEQHPHRFSLACLKMHRKVVQAIPAPWFAFAFSPDGLRQEACECLHFHQRAQAAGFPLVQAGMVGQRQMVTILPGPTGPRFRLDSQIGLRVHQPPPEGKSASTAADGAGPAPGRAPDASPRP
jgi:hypothetical protein